MRAIMAAQRNLQPGQKVNKRGRMAAELARLTAGRPTSQPTPASSATLAANQFQQLFPSPGPGQTPAAIPAATAEWRKVLGRGATMRNVRARYEAELKRNPPPARRQELMRAIMAAQRNLQPGQKVNKRGRMAAELARLTAGRPTSQPTPAASSTLAANQFQQLFPSKSPSKPAPTVASPSLGPSTPTRAATTPNRAQLVQQAQRQQAQQAQRVSGGSVSGGGFSGGGGGPLRRAFSATPSRANVPLPLRRATSARLASSPPRRGGILSFLFGSSKTPEQRLQNEMRKAGEQRQKEAQRVAKEQERQAMAMRKRASAMRAEAQRVQDRQRRQQRQQFGVPIGRFGGRVRGMPPPRRSSPRGGVQVYAGGQRRRF